MSRGLFPQERGIFVSSVLEGWPKGLLIILSGAQREPSGNRERSYKPVQPQHQWWRRPATGMEPSTGTDRMMESVISFLATLSRRWDPLQLHSHPQSSSSPSCCMKSNEIFLSVEIKTGIPRAEVGSGTTWKRRSHWPKSIRRVSSEQQRPPAAPIKQVNQQLKFQKNLLCLSGVVHPKFPFCIEQTQ